MIIEMIPFNSENIIPEGRYWIVTQRTYGKGYLSAMVNNSGNKMRVDVTNQKVLLISTKPCDHVSREDSLFDECTKPIQL